MACTSPGLKGHGRQHRWTTRDCVKALKAPVPPSPNAHTLTHTCTLYAPSTMGGHTPANYPPDREQHLVVVARFVGGCRWSPLSRPPPRPPHPIPTRPADLPAGQSLAGSVAGGRRLLLHCTVLRQKAICFSLAPQAWRRHPSPTGLRRWQPGAVLCLTRAGSQGHALLRLSLPAPPARRGPTATAGCAAPAACTRHAAPHKATQGTHSEWVTPARVGPPDEQHVQSKAGSALRHSRVKAASRQHNGYPQPRYVTAAFATPRRRQAFKPPATGPTLPFPAEQRGPRHAPHQTTPAAHAPRARAPPPPPLPP